jgi:hypothetical protein
MFSDAALGRMVVIVTDCQFTLCANKLDLCILKNYQNKLVIQSNLYKIINGIYL